MESTYIVVMSTNYQRRPGVATTRNAAILRASVVRQSTRSTFTAATNSGAASFCKVVPQSLLHLSIDCFSYIYVVSWYSSSTSIICDFCVNQYKTRSPCTSYQEMLFYYELVNWRDQLIKCSKSSRWYRWSVHRSSFRRCD